MSYRIIYRSGTYRDTAVLPAHMTRTSSGPALQDKGEPVWAVIDLDIIEGGDAYQTLLHTLEAEQA